MRAADMRLDLCARTEDPHIRSDWFARFSGARLLLFGGKGGVGKTTCAAATAIRLADADSSRRLLLLSTDPAHSLGDVLGAVLDDEPKPVRGAPSNLFARELDAPRALAGRRAEIESALEEITLTAGVAGDRTLGVREIVDLAPPGIDEVLGVVSVVNSLGLDADGAAPERSAFDVVVCDTAPTGHALRLLEMPDAAREWIQSLLRLLLKYRELVRPGKLAEQLVALSQSTRRLQALLRDPRQTAFVVVTRAAQVPRAETERLVTRVRALSLAIPATLVNAVTIDPPRCPWCRRVAAAERKIVTALSRSLRPRSRHCAIILTPLVAPPPRGVARLRTWAATWMPI